MLDKEILNKHNVFPLLLSSDIIRRVRNSNIDNINR